jgi:hypothetical protein
VNLQLDDLPPAARLALVGALALPGFAVDPLAAPGRHRGPVLLLLRRLRLATFGDPAALAEGGVAAAVALLRRYGGDEAGELG